MKYPDGYPISDFEKRMSQIDDLMETGIEDDLESSKCCSEEDRCNCGGIPLEQAGIEAGVNSSVYRIECSSCKKRTLWHDKEKCAWCEWKELQNE